MPQYSYRCPICYLETEINHSMSECDNPSDSTILNTTCNQFTCPILKSNNIDESNGGAINGTQWHRVPQCNAFLSYGNGDKMTGGTLSKEEKVSRLRKRADTPTKKDINQRKDADESFKNQVQNLIKRK